MFGQILGSTQYCCPMHLYIRIWLSGGQQKRRKVNLLSPVDVQEVPCGVWQDKQVQSLLSVDCYAPYARPPHSRLILGKRFALSRGETPRDLARKRGHKEIEQLLLNGPAWAPRPWFSSVSEPVLVETRRQLDNWKIWAKELRFFANVQYCLEASWTSR